MRFSLKGRCVLLTGATGGLGQALLKLLVQTYGCQVLAVGRNAEKLADLAKMYPPKQVWPFVMDVTDQTAWKQLAARFGQDLPTPSVLINNVGLLPPFLCFSKQSDQMAQTAMQVDYEAALLATKTLLPVIQAGRGGILNICSAGALCPLPGTAAQAAIKSR